MASEDDVQPVLTTCEMPRKPKRMLTSLEIVPIVPLGIEKRDTDFTLPVSQRRYCASEKSCAPPPVPSTTPISRLSSSDMAEGSRPESLSASVDAATASGTERETCFRSRASIQSSSLKSWISPAILTGRSEVSKRVMSLTPLLPSRMARQKAVFPIPLGLTTPRPVITARLSIDSDSIIDAGFMRLCVLSLHFFFCKARQARSIWNGRQLKYRRAPGGLIRWNSIVA